MTKIFFVKVMVEVTYRRLCPLYMCFWTELIHKNVVSLTCIHIYRSNIFAAKWYASCCNIFITRDVFLLFYFLLSTNFVIFLHHEMIFGHISTQYFVVEHGRACFLCEYNFEVILRCTDVILWNYVHMHI